MMDKVRLAKSLDRSKVFILAEEKLIATISLDKLEDFVKYDDVEAMDFSILSKN